MTTPNENIISEECREAANLERDELHKLEGKTHGAGYHIQALLNASTARLREQVETADAQVNALSGVLSNIADTCRSRGFPAGKPIDERVIAMAQEHDALKLHLASERNANRANVKVIAELRQRNEKLQDAVASLNSFDAPAEVQQLRQENAKLKAELKRWHIAASPVEG